MSDKDGGPAFPWPEMFIATVKAEGSECTDPQGRMDRLRSHQGMSLRDYFAGQIVSAFLALTDEVVAAPEKTAAKAYRLADAMLKVRGDQP